jgi:hypothetical protein
MALPVFIRTYPEFPLLVPPVLSSNSPLTPANSDEAVWMCTDPVEPLSEDPVRRLIEPPVWAGLLVDRPPVMTTWPEAPAPADGPAESEMIPPAPDVAVPTVRLMDPPRPPVADPERIEMSPVFPVCVVPVLNRMEPDTPSTSALALITVTAPDVVRSLAPDEILTAPPTAADVNACPP